MGTKRNSAEETQTQSEFDIKSTGPHKTARPTGAEQRAMARELKGAFVRKKYDFSVIRKLRNEKGLTIEDFAKTCGLSYAPISRIETNLIKPQLDTLDKIADGLGLATHSLIALAEKREIEQIVARETRSGTMTFAVSEADGVEVSSCSAKKGAASADIARRTQSVMTLMTVSGRLQAVVNDKPRELVGGDVLRFEGTFLHRFVALEDCSFVLVQHSRR